MLSACWKSFSHNRFACKLWVCSVHKITACIAVLQISIRLNVCRLHGCYCCCLVCVPRMENVSNFFKWIEIVMPWKCFEPFKYHVQHETNVLLLLPKLLIKLLSIFLSFFFVLQKMCTAFGLHFGAAIWLFKWLKVFVYPNFLFRLQQSNQSIRPDSFFYIHNVGVKLLYFNFNLLFIQFDTEHWIALCPFGYF